MSGYKLTKRKLSSTAACILFTMFSATAYAGTWTGCVNKGGQLKDLRQGDVPLRDCGSNERIVTLSEKASKQTKEVVYNQEIMCVALKEAGTTPNTLEKLGCPKGTEKTPYGDVIRVHADDPASPLAFVSDSNGIGFFELKNAFIGRHFQVPNVEENNHNDDSPCPTACELDDRCFAAWLDNAASDIKLQPSLSCHLFYRTDVEGVDWKNYCGFTVAQCPTTIGAEQPFWYRAENVTP